MSPGESAVSQRSPQTRKRKSTNVEPPVDVDETDLQALLEQLNYCLAIAKRLSDAALIKADPK